MFESCVGNNQFGFKKASPAAIYVHSINKPLRFSLSALSSLKAAFSTLVS